MSFLKGAERDPEMKATMDFAPAGLRQTGIEGELSDQYFEWDKMTNRQEENYECSSEARDYNNQDFDDSKSEIHLEDGPEPEGMPRDPYHDPFIKVDGGMASTEGYSLWKSLLPVFAEITRLDYFKTEIRAGNKQYKDFYVYFRQNLLHKFDRAIAF